MGTVRPQSTPEAKAPELAPGTVIADRYRVVERLGEGGMGVVYSAEHTHMRKLFALKVLHRELLRLPEVVSRFEREAVLAGSINHANVAAATDFGKLPDGSFFLILELVVGKSLRELIAEGPLEVSRALPIMRGMTAGVAAAHAKGIVHRDLKPDNVMLVERDGTADFVKVLDFGIAKGDTMPEPPSGPAQPLTQIGTIMGTPSYMSPEQALGQSVDHRSDLYALGVIFFELITGAVPFSGDALQVLRQHLTTEAPPIPAELVSGVAVPIASIVAKLLAKEPAGRFQNAAELLAALEGTSLRVSPRTPVVAETDDHAAPRPESTGRVLTNPDLAPPRGRLFAAAGSLGGVVLAVVILAVLFSHREPISAATADASTSTNVISAPAVAIEDPTPLAIATATPDPSDVTDETASPAASGSASAPPGGSHSLRGHRSPTARPAAPRRTGPGGIYIPPPREWFR